MLWCWKAYRRESLQKLVGPDGLPTQFDGVPHARTDVSFCLIETARYILDQSCAEGREQAVGGAQSLKDAEVPLWVPDELGEIYGECMEDLHPSDANVTV
jgi:hypothetical protein